MSAACRVAVFVIFLLDLLGVVLVVHGPFFCGLAGDAPTGWVVARERCCGLLYALFLHTPLVPSVEQVL